MCLIKCLRNKRIAKRSKKSQEQLNFVNEILQKNIIELKEILLKEIHSLEVAKTKEEFEERISKIEFILSNKVYEDNEAIANHPPQA